MDQNYYSRNKERHLKHEQVSHLLELLFENEGIAFSYEQISKVLWTENQSRRISDMHHSINEIVNKSRERLNEEGKNQFSIINIRDYGLGLIDNTITKEQREQIFLLNDPFTQLRMLILQLKLSLPEIKIFTALYLGSNNSHNFGNLVRTDLLVSIIYDEEESDWEKMYHGLRTIILNIRRKLEANTNLGIINKPNQGYILINLSHNQCPTQNELEI